MLESKGVELVASEALKPASKIIDALLAPKLQRLRNLAKKRELKSRVEDPAVQGLLDQYWKQVLSRASGIKTIVFPNEVIPLPSIYEPLKLKKSVRKFSSDSEQAPVMFTARDLQPGKSYLIIDAAGMGKSTFSKHLIIDIFSSTINTPLFLELRRIDDSETLLGRLAKDIDPSGNDVNEEFLPLLLDQGYYTIILDGYDELSENARQRIGEQIANLALKNEKNSFVLTSRPEVSLPEIPNSTVYNIQPLERKQAESLVLRYDSLANHTVGKGLIGEFNHISPEFLQTPLLLVLLYRTYSVNQTIAANVTTFYNDVYNAFYRGHDLTKSGFSRTKLSGLDMENFRRLLRGVAFLLLTEYKYGFKNSTEAYSIIEKATKITSVTPSSISNFFEDLITAVPVVINDGNEFRFIHKSICEFFAAEYLAFAPAAEKKVKILTEGSLARAFYNSFGYLAELNPSLFRSSVLGPFAKKYLVQRVLIDDPLLRTLHLLGITHVAFIERGDAPNPIPLDSFFATLRGQAKSGEFEIHLWGAKPKHIVPAIWKALGKELEENERKAVFEYADEKEINELRKIRGSTLLTSKKALKLANNRLFRVAASQALFFINVMPRIKIIDDVACRKILRVIQEERKAQNQIEALISRE